MDRKSVGPLAAFVACNALWGTTFLVIRIGASTMPPLWGATLRLAIAAAILAILTVVFRQRFPRGRSLLFVAVYGALEFGANLGFLYWAERVVPSGLAAVFYATAPLAAALLAFALRQEKLDAWRVAATLAAFAGVVVAFASQLGARSDPVALLAVFAAALSAGAAGLALARVPSMPVLPTNAVGCAVGALLLFPASLALREPIALPGGWSGWWPVLYLAIAGSVGAFTLFTYLLNEWGNARATLVGITVPVVALAVGTLVGGERLPLATLAGGALVLVGVAGAIARSAKLTSSSRGS